MRENDLSRIRPADVPGGGDLGWIAHPNLFRTGAEPKFVRAHYSAKCIRGMAFLGPFRKLNVFGFALFGLDHEIRDELFRASR
jgi:hypothetical protein